MVPNLLVVCGPVFFPQHGILELAGVPAHRHQTPVGRWSGAGRVPLQAIVPGWFEPFGAEADANYKLSQFRTWPTPVLCLTGNQAW